MHSDLRERQRIAFDRRGGVAVARAGVLLQRWNPGQFDRRALNPLAQHGYLLNEREQSRADGELGDVGHGYKSSISQVMCQAAPRSIWRYFHNSATRFAAYGLTTDEVEQAVVYERAA